MQRVWIGIDNAMRQSPRPTLVACFLAGAITVLGEEVRISAPAAPPGQAHAASLSAGELRTTLFQGRQLRYEVVDGMAVHAGDMILGAADEVLAASSALLLSKDGSQRPHLAPRHASTISTERLWPDGIVPYAIAADIPNNVRARILAAIQVWNTSTVINLVPPDAAS